MFRTKFCKHEQGQGPPPNVDVSDELNCQASSGGPELNNCTSGNSENWMVLSVSGDKPAPRFNV